MLRAASSSTIGAAKKAITRVSATTRTSMAFGGNIGRGDLIGETTGYDNKSLKKTIDELGYLGKWEREGNGAIVDSLEARDSDADHGVQEEVRCVLSPFFLPLPFLSPSK